MSKISPRNDRVLVQEMKSTASSVAGIEIVGNLGNSKLFKVVGVGSKVENVTEGDTVIVDLSKAVPVSIDGVQSILVPEDAVLATVEK